MQEYSTLQELLSNSCWLYKSMTTQKGTATDRLWTSDEDAILRMHLSIPIPAGMQDSHDSHFLLRPRSYTR
jgi:hypothetical protein